MNTALHYLLLVLDGAAYAGLMLGAAAIVHPTTDGIVLLAFLTYGLCGGLWLVLRKKI